MLHFLAVDLGATSGRTVLATFDDQRIQMREFTRFENPQLPLGGHIFWNLPHLYNEILRALRQVKAEGIELQSIGIDTWGCDFAFFGRDGQLLGLPHCYRDPHTDGAMERYFADRLPQQEVYERTGIQLMPFNSLFQLDTLRRNGCVALQEADKVLFMPDALIFMLTGQAVCEYTVASTSQMLNPRTGDLDEALLKTAEADFTVSLRGRLEALRPVTDETGKPVSHDARFPFSQYCELGDVYDDETLEVLPVVTECEVSRVTRAAGSALGLDLHVLTQCLVLRRTQVPVCEDAYCLQGELTPQCEEIVLPGILDSAVCTRSVRNSLRAMCAR